MKPCVYDPQIDFALDIYKDIPKIVLLTIAQNESNMNHQVKPYFEKTWRYFTTSGGIPITIQGKTATEIQNEAIRILGKEEFLFQVHAHGLCQVVGSVLRELGYKEKNPPADVSVQIVYACKHLNGLIQRFKKRYKLMPTHDQMFAMYNGGFGAIIDGSPAKWVEGYVKKSNENKSKFS